jgi:hypothetical protein
MDYPSGLSDFGFLQYFIDSASSRAEDYFKNWKNIGVDWI